MKRELFVGVGLVVAIGSWSGYDVQAQAMAQDAKAKTTSVTGCLAKGTDASSYMLNDAMPAAAAKEGSKESAKSTEMRSYVVMAKDASLKLDSHVGHKVTLTGTVDDMAGGSAGAAKTGAGAGAGAGAKAGASPHLMVTSMKHVAATCTP